LDAQKHDKIYAAMGATAPGAFALLPEKAHEKVDMSSSALMSLEFGYLNEYFIRTMFWINQSNLMNGIIEIPHEVCAQAGLPVWRDNMNPEPSEEQIAKLLRSMTLNSESEEAQQVRQQFKLEFTEMFTNYAKDMEKSRTFYAIPINHVLSWAINSEDFAEQMHIRTIPYKLANGATLYHLMASADFVRHKEYFCNHWIGKVDKRPLSNVAFEVVPLKEGQQPLGTATVRTHFGFFVGLQMNEETINNLAPALHPCFPKSVQWAQDQ
jgi:hypothetical protein